MASTFNKYKEPWDLKTQVNLIKALAHRLIFKKTHNCVYRGSSSSKDDSTCEQLFLIMLSFKNHFNTMYASMKYSENIIEEIWNDVVC